MDLLRIARPYREALSAYEALRRFGFALEHLKFACRFSPVTERGRWPGEPFEVGERALHVGMMATRGGASFSVACGPVREDYDAADSIWSEACLTWDASSHELLERIWRDSMAGRDLVGLGRTLVGRGFVLPPDPALDRFAPPVVRADAPPARSRVSLR